MAFKDTAVPETRCPGCKKKLDAAASLRGYVPEPGAISICAYCGAVAVFTEQLAKRAATEDEIVEFEANSIEFRQTRALLARMRQASRANQS